jgi:hypothetical protein
LRRADHSSKEFYQSSIRVRLRNLIREGQGPIWAAAPYKKKKILTYGGIVCIVLNKVTGYGQVGWGSARYVLFAVASRPAESHILWVYGAFSLRVKEPDSTTLPFGWS